MMSYANFYDIWVVIHEHYIIFASEGEKVWLLGSMVCLVYCVFALAVWGCGFRIQYILGICSWFPWFCCSCRDRRQCLSLFSQAGLNLHVAWMYLWEYLCSHHCWDDQQEHSIVDWYRLGRSRSPLMALGLVLGVLANLIAVLFRVCKIESSAEVLRWPQESCILHGDLGKSWVFQALPQWPCCWFTPSVQWFSSRSLSLQVLLALLWFHFWEQCEHVLGRAVLGELSHQLQRLCHLVTAWSRLSMYDSTGHDSNTGPQQLVHQLVHYPHNRLQVSSLDDEDNSLRLVLGIDLGWVNLLGDRFTSVSIHACAQVDYGKPNGKTVKTKNISFNKLQSRSSAISHHRQQGRCRSSTFWRHKIKNYFMHHNQQILLTGEALISNYIQQSSVQDQPLN